MGWIRGSPATPRGRRVFTLAFLVVAAIFLLGGARHRHVLSIETSGPLLHFDYHRQNVSGQEHLISPEVRRFWDVVKADISDLLSYTDHIPPIRMAQKATMEDQNPDLVADPDHPRLDILQLPSESVTALETQHAGMMRALPRLAEALPYRKHTRGIVTTAGGHYFSIALVMLRMLRRTGSVLPVTVFLDTHADYDAEVCDGLFPALGAECVVLAELLAGAPAPVPLRSYQYKAFALVFAPYQEVLFLDADAFPAHRPDGLFDAAPFAATGLVTWPDFWVSTASPLVYAVTRSGPPPPLRARRSSEAGILLYDRARHAADLVLALFYNLLGPDFYYPLLNQGSAGEGDKDTFLLAARVAGAPFYDVKTPVGVMGRWINHTWHSTGMKQADPAREWDLNPALRPRPPPSSPAQAWWRRIGAAAAAKVATAAHTGPGSNGPDSANHTAAPPEPQLKPAPPLFIHNNIIKLNVDWLFEPGTAVYETNQTGHYQRLWGSVADVTNDWGHDVEADLWEELVVVGCRMRESRCDSIKELARQLGGRLQTLGAGPAV